MRGFALRFRIVPGERISPNAIVWSSRTANVPFGDTFGVPSRDTVATNPRRCSSIILFMSGVSISGHLRANLSTAEKYQKDETAYSITSAERRRGDRIRNLATQNNLTADGGSG